VSRTIRDRRGRLLFNVVSARSARRRQAGTQPFATDFEDRDVGRPQGYEADKEGPRRKRLGQGKCQVSR